MGTQLLGYLSSTRTATPQDAEKCSSEKNRRKVTHWTRPCLQSFEPFQIHFLFGVNKVMFGKLCKLGLEVLLKFLFGHIKSGKIKFRGRNVNPLPKFDLRTFNTL